MGTGYGLTQFTPARKYIFDPNAQNTPGYAPNFYDVVGNASDGGAQIIFLDEYADYYPTSDYPETYSQFKVSTISIDYLTEAWCLNYERPGDPWGSMLWRQEAANDWYDFLSSQPDPPTPPEPPDPPHPPVPSGPIDFVVTTGIIRKRHKRPKQTYKPKW